MSNVDAVDARTGAPRWTRTFDAQKIGPNGPAVADGRVFAITSMNTLAALSAAPGETLWSWTVADPATEGITTPIAALDGIVYFSTAPAPNATNFNPPGGMSILFALETETGGQLWSLNTVKDGGCGATPS